MRISNMTLVKMGAIGGIITVSMGLALRKKINNDIKQTDYFKEALNTVRTNRGAVYLLGEPIRDGTIDVGNSENFTEIDTAQYKVPVNGSKRKGIVYFWAKKTDDNNDKWSVNRIELQLDNEPNRRLLIKNEE